MYNSVRTLLGFYWLLGRALKLYSGKRTKKKTINQENSNMICSPPPHTSSLSYFILLPQLSSLRGSIWTALHAWQRRRRRRRHQRQRRGEQCESGRADHRCGQAASVHRRHRRSLLGHPHGLQRLDLLPPQEEEGAEPLHRLLRIHTGRSGRMM